MAKSYFHPNWFGVGPQFFIQEADINIAVIPTSKQRILNPRELVRTQEFQVLSSTYEGGVLVSTIQFDGLD